MSAKKRYLEKQRRIAQGVAIRKALKAMPCVSLNLGQKPHKGDVLYPIKGRLKAKLRGERIERREAELLHGERFPCPGVKHRGKIGPSGSKFYKTWIRKENQ